MAPTLRPTQRGGEITLSLSGADSDKFELNDRSPVVSGSQVLAFKEAPDFENPGDSDGDNIYEATVQASDTVKVTNRSVTVKVTDADEDGEVTLSTQDAVVGRPITASLTDSDGEIARLGWTWQNTTPTAGQTCADVPDNATWTPINGAKEESYTPQAADNGDCLRAMARYMDRTTTEVDTDPTDTDPGDEVPPVRFINTAVSDTTTAVRDDPANQAPTFVDGTTTIRYVNENNDVATPAAIGDAVAATDGDGDTPVYTLSGTDAASFDIDAGTGQLMTKAALNHEDKNRYSVTVTADDSSGASNNTDRITVTIRVVDLDEAPVITNREFPNYTHEVTIDRAEDATGPVANFTARDPEGVTPIGWSLLQEDITQNLDGVDPPDDISTDDIADRGRFKISSEGVLTFSDSPSFEGQSLGTDPDDNYRVVVQASDGGLTDHRSWFKVTVTITDIEEPGKVTWTVDPDGTGSVQATDLPQPLLQFRVGAVLAATVTDGDGTPTDDSWKWYRSSNKRSWTEIIEQDPDATYTASDGADSNDVGMYLRVVASYEDARGGTRDAEFVSPNKVQGRLADQNTDPELVSGSPATRTVAEGPSDATVGGPVVGTDDDADVLTFALTGTDAEEFNINPATGQITTAVALNYEMAADDNSDNVYDVTVTAYDSSGVASNAVAVEISVTDINEVPTFSVSSPSGMVADHLEDSDTLTLAVDADTNTFTATDPEGGNITLSLMGDDSDKFEFVELAPPLDHSKMVAFKVKPDFEEPGDSDRNNIYEVTVRASDTVLTTDQSVTVKVTDADEDGKVQLPTQDAVVGTPLTATLIDSDSDVDLTGGVERTRWTWHLLDTQAVPATADNAIPKAKESSYTPIASQTGMYLKAMAWYMDRTTTEVDTVPTDNDPGDDVPAIGFINTATSMATTAVRDDPANVAPVFAEGAATIRYVNENTATATDIGDPVAATDADGNSVSFELGGTDMASFAISETGQLMTKAPLDHEDKSSYTVMVTADDNSGESNSSASITVTIRVMDLDEQPVISEAGLSVAGPPSISYAEKQHG